MKSKLFRTMTKVMALLIIFTLMPSGMGLADSGPQPEPAVPFGEEMTTGGGPGLTFSLVEALGLLSGAVFQNGGDRLADLQNNDGGWDWPLTDGNPTNASPRNTVGPIGQGLAEAYLHTGDPDHLSALQDAGELLLGKRNNFSPSDGYLAATLDNFLGGTTYTNHVVVNFYGPLAAGTYHRNGAGPFHTTESYVNLIRTSRSSQGIPNLAAWDLGMGLAGAAAVGADTTAWIAGVKAEIDELNGSADYDVIGLAGAIYGLAYVGVDYDPLAGWHAGADSLTDLGEILADYQLATGGFTWNSLAQVEDVDNETTQETAYAILALDKLNRPIYLGAIQAAAVYLESIQLPNGGWKAWAFGGENNEITGEALWGVHTVYSDVFDGFFQPVDMLVINTAKAGQTVPVKWRLVDADGQPVSDPSSFIGLASDLTACPASSAPDAIEQYVSGASELHYLGDGYWQFNWKTLKGWAGQCRTMYVLFEGDLSSPIVMFKFR